MLERLAEAEALTLDDYRADIAQRAQIRELFAQLGGLADGVITLSATGAAPVGLHSTGDPIFAVPGSLLGVPAISLPVLRAEDLPLGLQLLGFEQQDAALFSVAVWLRELFEDFATARCEVKLAVPDLISNSYFPAAAAVELGFFKREGLDVSLELLFPVSRAYEALRNGAVDFVGGSAHSALAAFPEWAGVKLLCAQGQGMYWFLVMHADLKAKRGDVSVVKGRSIGAAPWVDMGLRGLLVASGIDLERDGVRIAPVPGAMGAGVNFGVTAAKALEERKIDGFWANGMGAEVAVRRGIGTVVIDVRRGDGPKECFNYTMASVATTDRLIAEKPDVAAAAVRAIVKTQTALKADPSRATEVGRRLFPPSEAELIAELIRRDLPYYDASISQDFVIGMNQFARTAGILKGNPAHDQVVATQFRSYWNA